MGTRLIDSTPPATTTSAWPLMTVAAAKATACCEEPHCRSMVVPVTVSGQPAARGALRPMLKVCSPTWLTQPQNTSSTSGGLDPGPLDQGVQHVGGQVDGVDAGEPPAALAYRCTDRGTDDGITHGTHSSSTSGRASGELGGGPHPARS